jgi:hypothetical protein
MVAGRGRARGGGLKRAAPFTTAARCSCTVSSAAYIKGACESGAGGFNAL